MSTTKANRKKNKDEIAEYTEGIDIIRKYRQRIGILKEGAKTLKFGQGIYTQKKRNAYKINPQTGVYGNVTIDVPKLYGQLKLIAHKDGKKVYDKQVDFDTLDLLTKRFNSKKKYSPLSKMVFDDLNRIIDVDSREFLSFFIFCPDNLYSTLISKITLKLVTAFYFFLNRAKFEKR